MHSTLHALARARRLLLLVAMLSCCGALMHAQYVAPKRLEQTRLGVFAGAQAVQHVADFASLTGFPSCNPRFNEGGGSSALIGASIEISSSATLRHMVRMTYGDLGGTLTALENIPVVVDGTLQTARIQHVLSTRVRALEVEPLVHYQVRDGVGVFGGLRCSFLLGGTLEQYEELIAPSVGTFENNRRIRNRSTGTVFALEPLMASAVAGMRAILPMDAQQRIVCIPEISFSLALTNMTGNEKWTTNCLRAGVTFAYQWNSERRDEEQTPSLDVKSDISLSDGVRDVPQSRLTFLRNDRTDITSLLPLVFFDSAQTSIPSRYRSEDMEFSSTEQRSAAVSALRVARGVLGIVRRRIGRVAGDTLLLLASADTNDAASLRIAKARCANIQRYMREDSLAARAHVLVRIRHSAAVEMSDRLPANAVLMRSSEQVMSPFISHAEEHTWSPAFVRVRPLLRGSDDVASWELHVRWHDSTVKTLRGTGSLPASIMLDVQDMGLSPQTEDSLIISIIVNGASGITAASVTAVPVVRPSASADSLITDMLVIGGDPRFMLSPQRSMECIRTRLGADASATARVTLTANAETEELSTWIRAFRERVMSTAWTTSVAQSRSAFLSSPSPEAAWLQSSIILRHVRAR